jgi:hypothetical protein
MHRHVCTPTSLPVARTPPCQPDWLLRVLSISHHLPLSPPLPPLSVRVHLQASRGVGDVALLPARCNHKQQQGGAACRHSASMATSAAVSTWASLLQVSASTGTSKRPARTRSSSAWEETRAARDVLEEGKDPQRAEAAFPQGEVCRVFLSCLLARLRALVSESSFRQVWCRLGELPCPLLAARVCL